MEQMTMEWLDAFRSHAVTLPNLAKFAIVMAIIAAGPALARRLRIPELVGLLAFGVLLGPYVLDVAPVNHPIVQFFGDLGRLLLMFAAGLEIDLSLFRKAQTRSVIFGVITTMVPQVLGTAFGLAFGYGIIPSIVIGSLLASHTLLALPIVTRFGALGLEPVVVTIGATLVSDTLSLIVFGICVSVYTTGFSPSGLALQITEVAIFVPLVLIGVSRAGAWVLNKLHDSQEAYFVTMLGIMAVAGELANFINLPDIVGAFMAGLAVNASVGNHPAKEKLEFFGKSFFIPIFHCCGLPDCRGCADRFWPFLAGCGHGCSSNPRKRNRSRDLWSRLWLRTSRETHDVGTDAAAGCRYARRHVGRLQHPQCRRRTTAVRRDI